MTEMPEPEVISPSGRKKLQDRRFSETRRIPLTLDGQNQIHLLITIDYDENFDPPQPRGIFCADFKAGTALHAIVMDSCIMLSRLLQYGDNPEDLAKTLTPGSLLQVLCASLTVPPLPRELTLPPQA
jgi:hypothetical protein